MVSPGCACETLHFTAAGELLLKLSGCVLHLLHQPGQVGPVQEGLSKASAAAES